MVLLDSIKYKKQIYDKKIFKKSISVKLLVSVPSLLFLDYFTKIYTGFSRINHLENKSVTSLSANKISLHLQTEKEPFIRKRLFFRDLNIK